jgi:TolA-binding protein
MINMKNSYRITYIFLFLSIGIVSTIFSNPILGQTQNNSQSQQGETGGAGPYTSGKPDIESAEELEKITNDTPTRTSNDTTPMLEELGKETQSGNQTTEGQQQQGNQTTGGQQQQGNQTTGGQQQQGNQTTGGQQQQGNQTTGEQQGNQSDNPLSNVGKAIGDLFK